VQPSGIVRPTGGGDGLQDIEMEEKKQPFPAAAAAAASAISQHVSSTGSSIAAFRKDSVYAGIDILSGYAHMSPVPPHVGATADFFPGNLSDIRHCVSPSLLDRLTRVVWIANVILLSTFVFVRL
jgi:hypothetical protein